MRHRGARSTTCEFRCDRGENGSAALQENFSYTELCYIRNGRTTDHPEVANAQRVGLRNTARP
jgi:hypothetical protein